VTITQARELRATALSPSAFNVLLELADARDQILQPCSLADRLTVSRPSMCGLIDGLQAKGLVTRSPHQEDGRRVLVGLSAAGRQLLDEHRASYDAMLDDLLDDLVGSDRQRLVGLLQRIGR
jgi:DNA-binding MarR family transcriptional regulator